MQTNSNKVHRDLIEGWLKGRRKQRSEEAKRHWMGSRRKTQAEGQSAYSSGFGLALGKGSEARSPRFLNAKLLGSASQTGLFPPHVQNPAISRTLCP